jgi:hypothetical protein
MGMWPWTLRPEQGADNLFYLSEWWKYVNQQSFYFAARRAPSFIIQQLGQSRASPPQGFPSSYSGFFGTPETTKSFVGRASVPAISPIPPAGLKWRVGRTLQKLFRAVVHEPLVPPCSNSRGRLFHI